MVILGRQGRKNGNKQRKQWNLPNLLTVYRVIAAPTVALVYVALPRPAADIFAFFLFVSAALTDFLDGYLARKWNQVSAFGRMLDPIADKAMTLIALAVLCSLFGNDKMLLIPVAVIFLREVLVSGMREFLEGKANLQVTNLAKWKTTVQMVAISVLFIASWAQAYGGDTAAWLAIIGNMLLWAAAILTAITGWDYYQKAAAFIAENMEK